MKHPQTLTYREIVVCFLNGDGIQTKFLKKGFSHVFHGVRIGDYIYIDEHLKHRTALDVFRIADLEEHVRLRGGIIITVKQSRTKRWYPFALNTCVSHVKIALGINKLLVFTPYQLYKQLKDKNVS